LNGSRCAKVAKEPIGLEAPIDDGVVAGSSPAGSPLISSNELALHHASDHSSQSFLTKRLIGYS
jgi:hypothetical protein